MTRATILCVEDEPLLRGDLSDELRDAGYRVLEARNGAEAFESLAREPADLVLCDVSMPDGGGYELLERLRRSSIVAAPVPFVFLTARGAKDEQIRGRELGADDYLVKPVDFDLLLSVVRSRLGSVERQRQFVDAQTRTTREHLEQLIHVAAPQERDIRADVLDAMQGRSGAMDLLLFRTWEIGREELRLTEDLSAEAEALLRTSLKSVDEQAGSPIKLTSHFSAVVLPVADDFSDRIRRLEALRFQQAEVGGRTIAIGNLFVVTPTTAGTRQTLEAVLDDTLVAMHIARRDGVDEVVVLTPEKIEQMHLRRDIEQSLPRAIESGELQLQYEPKVAFDASRIVGVEALARWVSPQLGPVAPALFIPLIERLGLIRQFTDWVLCEALRAQKTLLDRGHPIRVAVNISGRDLTPDLVDRVQAALRTSGASAPLLEIEVTETAVIQDTAAAAQALCALRALGVHIAIDDFGTGHASMAYLHRFPAQSIKIERMFVAGLLDEPVDEAIISSVIALGSSLQIQVVAEGVESEQQMNKLRALGCQYGQGYLFSRSLTLDELLALIQAGAPFS